MSRRSCHWLNLNHAVRVPRRVLCVSVVPHVRPTPDLPFGEEHSLSSGVGLYYRLDGGAVVSEDAIAFTDPEPFWRWVESKMHSRERLWCFVTSASYVLTLLNLWERIRSRAWTVRRFVSADPPTTLDCAWSSKCATIVDTRNYWRSSSRVTCRSLPEPLATGLAAAPFGFSASDASRETSRRTLDRVTALIRLLSDGELGSWHPTAAGLAWSMYRHRFAPKRWARRHMWAKHWDCGPTVHEVCNLCPHRFPDALALEAEAYRGGRADCHFIGEVNEEICHVDYNAFYPSVMRLGRYPTRLREVCGRTTVPRLRQLAEEGCVVARVRLQSPDVAYPVATPAGGRYAVGTFATVLATPEVLHALGAGHVTACDSVACYEAGRPFVEFVDYTWGKRQERRGQGDQDGAEAWKLLGESLYGKFAQRARRWVTDYRIAPLLTIGAWWDRDPDNGERVYCQSLGGPTQVRRVAGWHRDAFPAVAAHVTSYGRVKMLETKELCNQGRVYYEDTDSLHVSLPAYQVLLGKGLLQYDKLGALKLAARARGAEYCGVRDYTLGGRSVVAGVKHPGAVDADGRVVQSVVPGMASVIAAGGPHTVRVNWQHLLFRRDRYAGRLDPEGWVKPLVIHET